ncbi:MAG: response regulator, partial [Clostridium sp.]
ISLLLVDDDSHVLGYLKKRLTHKGYRVDAYTDPQKAMDAMKQQPNRWDAAVLDYMMPLYKGTTLAQHMKKLHPTVGIIMITGMVERDALQLKLDGIIDHIIIKPVKFEELLTSIDWLVKKKGDEE